MKEILDSVLDVLIQFQDDMLEGFGYGALIAVLALAISRLILQVRVQRLEDERRVERSERIDAGELKGIAEGLHIRKDEINSDLKNK